MHARAPRCASSMLRSRGRHMPIDLTAGNLAASAAGGSWNAGTNTPNPQHTTPPTHAEHSRRSVHTKAMLPPLNSNPGSLPHTHTCACTCTCTHAHHSLHPPAPPSCGGWTPCWPLLTKWCRHARPPETLAPCHCLPRRRPAARAAAAAAGLARGQEGPMHVRCCRALGLLRLDPLCKSP